MTIIVLSQQHTGTWSVIQYLLDHKEVDGFQQLWAFGERGRDHRFGIGLRIRESMGENMVVHDHIDVASHRYAPLLVHHFPVIVPLRDPLASLITKHSREPKAWPHEGFIENWWYCADVLDRDVRYVMTIDQHQDWAMLSRSCQLEPVNPPSIINAGPRTVLHRAYAAKDTAMIVKTLGQSWSLLRSLEPSLRPILEQHEYRNLMWWS